LAVEVAIDTREGNQCEIASVEHQFNTHEDNDRVATHNNSDCTDGE
jgi:hypothetical protein